MYDHIMSDTIHTIDRLNVEQAVPKTPILSPKNPRKPKQIKKKTERKSLGQTKADLKRRGKLIIKEIMNGSSQSEALIRAGYSKTYAIMKGKDVINNPTIRQTFTTFLEKAGLDDEALAAKIAQLCAAKETKFFSDKGKVTDQREVEALNIQLEAVKHVTKLKGYVTDKTSVEAPGIEELLRELRAKRQE